MEQHQIRASNKTLEGCQHSRIKPFDAPLQQFQSIPFSIVGWLTVNGIHYFARCRYQLTAEAVQRLSGGEALCQCVSIGLQHSVTYCGF